MIGKQEREGSCGATMWCIVRVKICEMLLFTLIQTCMCRKSNIDV